LADLVIISVCILVGVLANSLLPFARKLIANDLALNDFQLKYVISIVTSAVWTWILGTGIYIGFAPPDLPSEALVYLVAFVYGWGGEDAQKEVVRVINTIYLKKKTPTPPPDS
jgi:hypothetical protein